MCIVCVAIGAFCFWCSVCFLWFFCSVSGCVACLFRLWFLGFCYWSLCCWVWAVFVSVRSSLCSLAVGYGPFPFATVIFHEFFCFCLVFLFLLCWVDGRSSAPWGVLSALCFRLLLPFVCFPGSFLPMCVRWALVVAPFRLSVSCFSLFGFT